MNRMDLSLKVNDGLNLSNGRDKTSNRDIYFILDSFLINEYHDCEWIDYYYVKMKYFANQEIQRMRIGCQTFFLMMSFLLKIVKIQMK